MDNSRAKVANVYNSTINSNNFINEYIEQTIYKVQSLVEKR